MTTLSASVVNSFLEKLDEPSRGFVVGRARLGDDGRDCAVASTLFHRASVPGKVGRQMQTWVRFPEGWRVVAAHVSVIDEPKADSR